MDTALRPRLFLALLPVVCILGCHSLSSVRQSTSILFTKIPPYAGGSAEHLESIEGRVSAAQPGQRIVLYAKSGVWWVQPVTDNPFTKLEPDLTWKNQTHPGTEYAALLVDAGYRPRWKTDQLPDEGGPIAAVAVVKGRQASKQPEKTLLFGGYEWKVRQISGGHGGSHNDFATANAWTDPGGSLHLRIDGSPDHWSSAEVDLGRSLGYGSYRFVVRDVAHLEPSAVFTMLTFAEGEISREMDIEISRWGEFDSKNGQFVIQPYSVPANTVRFDTPARTVTYMLRWAPDRAVFRAYRGAPSRWEAKPFREHVFTSGVPSPGNESVRMTLYVFANNTNPLRHGTEVIVDNFEYLP